MFVYRDICVSCVYNKTHTWTHKKEMCTNAIRDFLMYALALILFDDDTRAKMFNVHTRLSVVILHISCLRFTIHAFQYEIDNNLLSLCRRFSLFFLFWRVPLSFFFLLYFYGYFRLFPFIRLITLAFVVVVFFRVYSSSFLQAAVYLSFLFYYYGSHSNWKQ